MGKKILFTSAPLALAACATVPQESATLSALAGSDYGLIDLNGRTPRLGAGGELSGLTEHTLTGAVAVPGRSIVFVAVPGATNPAYR